MSQEDAALLFGVSYGVYQKYESDRTIPGGDAVKGFIEAGINANWLMTGEGPMLLEDAKQLPPELQAGIDFALSFAGDEEAKRRLQARQEEQSAKSRQIEADLQAIEIEEGLQLPQLTRMNFWSLMAMDQAYTPVIRLAVKELAEFIRQIEAKSAPIPTSPVNYKLLQDLIESLETALDERNLELTPARKAAVIQLMYEYCKLEDDVSAPATVERFLKLVA